jgi:hypothetical protein
LFIIIRWNQHTAIKKSSGPKLKATPGGLPKYGFNKQIVKLPTPEAQVYKVEFIAEDTQYLNHDVAPSSTLGMSANTRNTTKSAARRK